MQIVEKKVADLKAYDKNPRRNDKAVDAVAESIKKFGFKVPIVIDKNDVIVAGHTRLKASIKLGIEYVPCVVADDLTPEQVRAFRLADNRTAEIASWDDDLLADELKSLDGIIDMSDFGFDLELTKNDLEKIEEDDIPADPPTRCKTGDLWKLGDHLLYCGSSTERESYEHCPTCDLWLTDPPYNVNVGAKVKAGALANDNLPDDEYSIFERQYIDLGLEKLKGNGAFYIWAGTNRMYEIKHYLETRGDCYVSAQLIWVKSQATLSFSDYRWQHEQAWYGWKTRGDEPHYFTPMRTNTTVQDLNDPYEMDVSELRKEVQRCRNQLNNPSTVAYAEKITSSMGDGFAHPDSKPVSILGLWIANSTRKGEWVLDSFGGSGSTLIACEQLGRKCFTIELEPRFCDTIIERWEAYTGLKAERINDGSTEKGNQ